MISSPVGFRIRWDGAIPFWNPKRSAVVHCSRAPSRPPTSRATSRLAMASWGGSGRA